MNNYCIYLKKRKNKPYCNFKKESIELVECKNCSNKEYRTKIKENSFYKQKKSTYSRKSPVTSEKNAQPLVKMHNKSKKLTKLERNRSSVFSNDSDKCYLCGSTYNLTWHEIFAGRNRQNSMKFGFCLRLCLNCHSKEQENSQFNAYWHKQGQLYWEKNIGSREEFIKVFRKNYLSKNITKATKSIDKIK